ncbi:hypothetical protein [Phocaeicola sp.]
MKKESTLQIPAFANLKIAFHSYVESYASVMSLFLGESISISFALRITHAVLAGIFLLFSSSAGVVACLLCFAWFILALYSCKKGGAK